MFSRAGWICLVLLICRIECIGQTELRLPLARITDEDVRHPKYKVREIVVEAEPDHACPENFEKSGTACVQVETTQPSKACLPGWQKGPNDTCVGYTADIPDQTCVKGSSQYGKCLISNSLPKQLICRHGFSLDTSRGLCVKDLSSELIRTCPPGSHWDGDKCKTTEQVPFTITCPTGFRLNQNRCERVTQSPLEQTCAEGFIFHPLKKKCLKEVKLEPIISCPAPSVMKFGVCTTETSVPVNVSCLPDQELSGNLCISHERATPQFKCPGQLIMNLMTNLCEGNEVVDPIPECTKGTFFNPLTGQCGSAFKVKQPNLACPPEFHFAGKKTCVRHVQEMGTKICPPGFTLESKEACVMKRQTPAKIACPPGSIQQGSFCLITGQVDRLVNCPPETQLEGNVCVGIVYDRPVENCPPGFFGGGGKQNLCVKKETVAPTQRCPQGTERAVGSDGLICTHAVTVPANKFCPPGQRRVDQVCMETISEPVEEACPAGFYEDLEVGRCFTSELLPSQSVCPVGFKLVGGKCLKQHIREAELVCPPTYVRSGPLECKKQTMTPMINLCPFGFEFDGLKGVCKTVKVKYEFDGAIEETTTVAPTVVPKEALKDLDVPHPQHTAVSTVEHETTTEAQIEVQVTRPIVQKGLIVRNEVVTLSGPAAEVAAKQKLLNSGGSMNSLGDNVKIEYAPAVVGV